MPQTQQVDEHKAVLTKDEWAALSDDLKALYEADGDTYVADEAKLAEARARDADEESTGDDVGQDDGLVDDHINDEPVEFDDELLTKFELSEAEFSSLPEDIQGGYEFKFGKWRAVPEMRESIEKCMAAYAEAMAERDATIAAKQAEYERLDRQLRFHIIKSAAQSYLIQAGCKPGLMRAAIALFVGSHTINTIRQQDGSWDIEVEGEDGIVDLEHGLASFLAAADGNVFLDKPNLVLVN